MERKSVDDELPEQVTQQIVRELEGRVFDGQKVIVWGSYWIDCDTGEVSNVVIHHAF
jgi:hypothetical protein